MANITRIDHPINTYIKSYLGLPVEQFARFTGFPQSTLASWVSRNRRVDSLPISFYDAVARINKRTIDQTYKEFIELQDTYDRYLQEGIAQLHEPSIYVQAANEAKEIVQAYQTNTILEYLVKPTKKMKKALDKKDKLSFIESIIEIYSTIGKAVPQWLLHELQKKQDFLEIGTALYNNLQVK